MIMRRFYSILFLSALSTGLVSAFHSVGLRRFAQEKNPAARRETMAMLRFGKSSLSLFQDFGDDDGSFFISESDRRRMQELYERYVMYR